MTKTCTKCKKILDISNFNVRGAGEKGYRSHCRTCSLEAKAKHIKENPEKYNNQKKAWCKKANKTRRHPIARYNYSKYKALREGREFSLTLEQYLGLLNQNCYYDNAPLPKTGKGLDRLDSNKGYSLNNVVPCCAFCNRAKSSKSKKDFTKWIKTVYKNLLKKETRNFAHRTFERSE
jgi:hypothetical protein